MDAATDQTDSRNTPSPVANPQLPIATALYITDWDQHYETNKDGRRWEAGQVKRKGALVYVRLYVFGPAGDNVVYADVADTVAEKYGDDAWCVAWGLFCKLLEVAARQKPDQRGFLLGRRASPISARMLRNICRFSKSQIELGLTILADPDVAWIQSKTFSNSAVFDNLGEVGDGRRDRRTPQETKRNEYKSDRDQCQDESQRQTSGPGESGPADRATASEPTGDGIVEIAIENFDVDSVGDGDSDDSRFEKIDCSKLLATLRKCLWPDGATQAQLNGDYTSLLKMVRAVQDGAFGSPSDMAAECVKTARDIAPKNGNKMARFSAWFNKRLPGDVTIRDLPEPHRGRNG